MIKKTDSKINQSLQDLDSVLKEWNSTSMGRRSFLKVIPLLLASCSTIPQTQYKYREGDNSGQAVSLSPLEEKRMSEQVLPQMRKDYPPIKDPEVQSYVSRLGQRVVKANGLDASFYNYTFQVVQTPQVNAFALPAGPVFITAPLIAMVDTEAELVGVVGHEIGHIKARHTAERIYRMEQSRGKTIANLLGGGILGGILGYGVGKLICASNDRECKRRALQLGVTVGAAGGALISKYGFMAHSREDELEADRVGFRASVKAGYSKEHVGDFYEKLLVMEEQSKIKSGVMSSFTDAMSTHPPSRQRVQQMKIMAKEVTGFGKGKVSSQDFDRIKAKINS